ncbi:hypothetical protein [Saccharothrix hoggarensis]|uniref:Uncharacterized protein n=1 Tax=Saccharothrix hoggarensis TaxID=913853 RepID=A0ABW3QDY5_9PSEU
MPTAAHVVVSGPGGCGKTALLRDLGERFTVVDDAHLQSDEVIAWQAGDRRLFAIGQRVPHRNRRLDEAVRDLGPDVVRIRLGPLRQDQVAGCVRERVGTEVTGDEASALFDRTGGVPAFLLSAVSSDPIGSLAPVLDAFAPGVRRLVSALALGAPLDRDLLGAALDLDAAALMLAVDGARAASALRPDGTLVPIVAQACRALTDPGQCAATLRDLVAAHRGRRQPIRRLAVSLLESPIAAMGQAELLVAAGREAMGGRPGPRGAVARRGR